MARRRKLRRNSDGDSLQESIDLIENTEWTEKQVRSTEAWLHQFEYATTALYVLSNIIRDDHDDEVGANLVLELANRYMKHEAKQI